MDAIFAQFNKQLEEEGNVREEIKKIVHELDQTLRKAIFATQQVHSDLKQMKAICTKVKEDAYPQFKAHFAALQKLVTTDNYYRHAPQWKNEVQQIVFLVAFITWLETRTLADLSDIEALLGVPGKKDGVNAFAVELEDYLIGLTFLPPELARLCLNSAIAGDYQLPTEIVRFVSDLYAGYRLLNLKNDYLRKRVDGIKYDVKRVEEIVYDITVRGLNKSLSSSSSSAATSTISNVNNNLQK
jgi:predicted translin family RNA/ssDNA-binding protein